MHSPNRYPKLLGYRNVGYSGLSLHPEGKLIAICSIKDLIQLWELETGDLLASRHQALASGVQFSADGLSLASTAIRSHAVRVWDVREMMKNE